MSSDNIITEREVALPVAELPPGSSTSIKAFGTTVAIFNVGGCLFATGNHCPHHGAPLCHGRISGTMLPSRPQEYSYGREGEVLKCPWHGWEFDLQSGKTLFDPAVGVKVYGVEVEDGQIVITRQRRSPTSGR